MNEAKKWEAPRIEVLQQATEAQFGPGNGEDISGSSTTSVA